MTRRWFRNQQYNHATEEFPCPPPPMVAASELAQPPEGLFPWIDQPASRGFLNREPTGYVKGCDVFAPPSPATPMPTAPKAMSAPPDSPVYEMKGVQPMDERDLACFVECFDLARAAIDERDWNAAAAWSGAASGWAQEFPTARLSRFGGHMTADRENES